MEKIPCPLGNGDLAANVWTEQNGYSVLLLAKSDAWTELGKLVKLGRVRIKLSPNPFVGASDFRLVCSSRGVSPVKFNSELFTVGHDMPKDKNSDNADHDPDYRAWGNSYWNQNSRLIYWPLLATGDLRLNQHQCISMTRLWMEPFATRIE